MKFGAILKACRTRAGFSQEELAEKLFINQSDISKYESDRKEPTMSLFQAWMTNTQSPEVAVAFMYGLDGINLIQQLMPIIGGWIAWF
ncbi:helix-turn-helix domain-containing protein [Cytobacillus firmus]|uniref:helix-turn-helix domain-containing protein n=1 Tax=Cytobacillus TaxID=2675230 RepID=UPI00207A2AD9|nr:MULTISPECIES: helix-turn-helix transcriptional regulator [Cytobacillus]UQX52311.1 helix-turn-helix domain-containing protein [Cytobacillus pseudoceanisediminis]USK40146.1 helix-turn-helix domain-containing protein [Cytobacillus firmus]